MIERCFKDLWQAEDGPGGDEIEVSPITSQIYAILTVIVSLIEITSIIYLLSIKYIIISFIISIHSVMVTLLRMSVTAILVHISCIGSPDNLHWFYEVFDML